MGGLGSFLALFTTNAEHFAFFRRDQRPTGTVQRPSCGRSFGLAALSLGALALVVFASGGCNKTTEAVPEAKTVSIPGTADAPAPSSPSPTNSSRPASSIDRYHPKVEIVTNFGPITVELDAAKAPTTVDNFLGYVERGHYDQTLFHQVLKGYAIMGGAYTLNGATLLEKPTRTPIPNEAQSCGMKNLEGTITMVRQIDALDSATCQFFINLADNPSLDYKNSKEFGYCPFGKVVAGMDVVQKIASVDVSDTAKEVDFVNKDGKTEKRSPLFERIPKENVVIQSIRRIP